VQVKAYHIFLTTIKTTTDSHPNHQTDSH